MSYSKQTWSTGDTVTAAKLNHMEDGIAEAGGGSSGGGDIVVVAFTTDNDDNWVADKTYSELVTANTAGKVILGVNNADNASVANAQFDVGYVFFTFFYDAKGDVAMYQLQYASDGTITES